MTKILEELEQFDLLEDGAKIVCETEKEEEIETNLTLLKEKRYGSKRIHIYTKER